MNWLSKLVKNTFSSAAQDNAAERRIVGVDEQWARHKLGLHMHDHGASDYDRFIKASDFLDTVENVASRHPFGGLVISGPQAKVGARLALMDAVAGGKCPFFYEKKGEDAPVFVEDMYVPVKHLARHGLWLLDKVKSTTSAGVYGDALEESKGNFLYRFDLTYHDRPMAFVDKGEIDESFEIAEARRFDEAGRQVGGLHRVLKARAPEGLQP